jgi:hypothetical protein
MPGIGQPSDPPTSGIGAPLFKPPGSSNISLPTDPRFVWTSVGGYVPRTTSGPSPRPLTLGEALQEQQREQANAARAAWLEDRKRRTEKKYTPSPSSVASHQSSHQRQRYAKELEKREDVQFLRKEVVKIQVQYERIRPSLRDVVNKYGYSGLIMVSFAMAGKRPGLGADFLRCLKLGYLCEELDELTRTYLIARACDLARYGEKVADRTFPQPTIEGVTAKQLADLVDSLVTLL